MHYPPSSSSCVICDGQPLPDVQFSSQGREIVEEPERARICQMYNVHNISLPVRLLPSERPKLHYSLKARCRGWLPSKCASLDHYLLPFRPLSLSYIQSRTEAKWRLLLLHRRRSACVACFLALPARQIIMRLYLFRRGGGVILATRHAAYACTRQRETERGSGVGRE